MIISNYLVEDSLSFDATNKDISTRHDEIIDLYDLIQYCETLNEKVRYRRDLMYIRVNESLMLFEYLYIPESASQDDEDYIRYFKEMISKYFEEETEDLVGQSNVINCSLGEYGNASYNLLTYLKARREYLKQTKNHFEYAAMMRSCFPNCVFSLECDKELGKVDDYKNIICEITDCLEFIDENAISYFEKEPTEKDALKRLEVEFGRHCSNDSSHKKYLYFEFEYDNKDEIDSEKVLCEQHFKLVRPDSNVRIYFNWKNEKIGDNKKVLIGRIGRHPY